MLHRLQRLIRPSGFTLCMVAAMALQGCGGGSDGKEDTEGSVYFDAPFTASNLLQEQCRDLSQKKFIRSYLDEAYLWPDLVQRKDATAYADVRGYFAAILAPKTVDRFSFSLTAEEADAQENALAFDPGIHWTNTGSSTAPIWRVSRLDPGSPAETAGIRRGDTLVGKVSTNLDSATGPYFYNFTYLRNGLQQTVSLVPTTIEEDPVGNFSMLVKDGLRVGYIAFDAHFGNAQDQLITQMRIAEQAGLNELVVDLRYNGGGFLSIAGSLASMLAPERKVVERNVFVELRENAKLEQSNERQVLRLDPFVLYTNDQPTYPSGTLLPNLNLNRVYVLTSSNTCSASETLINGLRGVGVTVHVIGDTTCGKPYASSREENCGIAYYPITSRGVNATGWGAFQNGFTPTCQVEDDLDHERGDPNEALFSAAITHMESGACPVNVLGSSQRVARTQMSSQPLISGAEPPRRERQSLTLVKPD